MKIAFVNQAADTNLPPSCLRTSAPNGIRMISRAELVDRYFDADIFTIPSVWDESFGVFYSGGIWVAMGGLSSVHPNHRDFDCRRLPGWRGSSKYPEIDEGFDELQIVAFGAKNPGIYPIIPALRFRYDRLNHQAAGSATVFGGVHSFPSGCGGGRQPGRPATSNDCTKSSSGDQDCSAIGRNRRDVVLATMRKVDAWQSLNKKPSDQAIDLAA